MCQYTQEPVINNDTRLSLPPEMGARIADLGNSQAGDPGHQHGQVTGLGIPIFQNCQERTRPWLGKLEYFPRQLSSSAPFEIFAPVNLALGLLDRSFFLARTTSVSREQFWCPLPDSHSQPLPSSP